MYEPKEICAHNETKAAQINERRVEIPPAKTSLILPPKLPPKASGTEDHCEELLVHMGQNPCGDVVRNTTKPNKTAL